MTDANNGMNPLHFGSNSADIHIRINADSNTRLCLFEILASAEVCAQYSNYASYSRLRLSSVCSVWLSR